MGQEQKTRALYDEQVRREQARNSLTFDLSASLQPGEQPACACNPGTTAMPVTQPPPARERAGHESAPTGPGQGGGCLSPLLILSQVQTEWTQDGGLFHALASIGSDLESGASWCLGGACKLGLQLKQAAPPPGLEVGMKGLCMQRSFLQMVLSSFCCTP